MRSAKCMTFRMSTSDMSMPMLVRAAPTIARAVSSSIVIGSNRATASASGTSVRLFLS
jgi:hypothetical protein